MRRTLENGKTQNGGNVRKLKTRMRQCNKENHAKLRKKKHFSTTENFPLI